MKVAYFATYYEDFIRAYLAARPEFHTLPYAQQYKRLLAEPFGTFGSYVRAARRAGAHLLVANFEPLQRQWARENSLAVGDDWQRSVVAVQVRALKPDAHFIPTRAKYNGPFLSGLRTSIGALAGWISFPMPPSLVEPFRARGIRSEVLPEAFDVDVLASLGDEPKTIPVSLGGGMTGARGKQKDSLEAPTVGPPLEVRLWPSRAPGQRLVRPPLGPASATEGAASLGLALNLTHGRRYGIGLGLQLTLKCVANMRFVVLGHLLPVGTRARRGR